MKHKFQNIEMFHVKHWPIIYNNTQTANSSWTNVKHNYRVTYSADTQYPHINFTKGQPIFSCSPKRAMAEINQNLHKTTNIPPYRLRIFYLYGTFLIKTCKNHRKQFYQNAKTAEFNQKIYSQTHITIQKPPTKQRELDDQLFGNSTKHPKPNHLITATVLIAPTHICAHKCIMRIRYAYSK